MYCETPAEPYCREYATDEGDKENEILSEENTSEKNTTTYTSTL